MRNPVGRLRRRAAEQPTGPLPGFKLGYPMVSADGARAGFGGVTLGRGAISAPAADAVCIQEPKHRCPARGCDCGFYCLHSADEARALAAEPGYEQAALLEVEAAGRFIRYERGLRYSHQRVRAVRVGRCDCGRPGEALADAGGGAVGWRRLAATCSACAGTRPACTLPGFARVAGLGLEVTQDSGVAASAARFAPLTGFATPTTGSGDAPEREQFAQLSAEAALLQARLDELQAQLDRITSG